MKRVTLGMTGIETSYLAIGTGSNGWGGKSDQTRKGRRWLGDLLVEAYAAGVTFWDLADQYGSHRYAKQALARVERESVTILTKTTSNGYEDTKGDIERFLREIGTDYLDIVLLHCMGSHDWTRSHAGARRAFSEAKEQGLIRAVGVSNHDFGALQTAAREPWVEFILARFNHSGASMEASPEEVSAVLEKAHDNGKAVCAMKVLGAGKLAADPERAIRYVTGFDWVDSLTIGVTDSDQLRRNLNIVESAAGESEELRTAV